MTEKYFECLESFTNDPSEGTVVSRSARGRALAAQSHRKLDQSSCLAPSIVLGSGRSSCLALGGRLLALPTQPLPPGGHSLSVGRDACTTMLQYSVGKKMEVDDTGLYRIA
ncbi:KLTH0D16676p [Lachancea thermotolerans CBS 6340]|uniref:KLTH0D16676p n=1 Tax=Lachancea thermotolerans (strain ATCC 56472 / CBS 6340 / NRRL Y-8284) TaxID=559295 RepID=C5DFP0_LACTC|nr:KLTH0D16676p [Lachancea thermotolerans CBS 6340]CAR22995.1 KLTH0D16676p [Lachancea thermotolerans CBS 6340]